MKTRYIGIVGCHYYHSHHVFTPGLTVFLIKDHENHYDSEAIQVIVNEFGKAGYVANSIHTVPQGCCSAGRVYDSFSEITIAIVRFIAGNAVIAELVEGVEIKKGAKKKRKLKYADKSNSKQNSFRK